MKIEIEIDPIPASRPRVARFGTYYKEPYNSYRELLKWQISQQFKELPIRELKSPLFITFIIEPCKSIKKNKKKYLSLLGTPHTQKPDIDNLIKGVFDSGNGLLWNDDSIIDSLTTNKQWGEKGLIRIEFLY